MAGLPPFRVGFWQDETPAGGVGETVRLVGSAIGEARREKVDILAFPECFLTGYFRPAEEVPLVAATVTREVLGELSALADDAGMGLVIGSYQAVEGGTANAAHVFLPGTNGPLTYHKRALFGEWEKSVFINGGAPLAFDFRGRKCAVLICFDVEFPELVRELVEQGVDTVLVPTALMSPEDDAADFLVPARALENGITLVYANRIGSEGSLDFVGKSQICVPDSSARKLVDAGFRGLVSGEAHREPAQPDYPGERSRQKLP